MKKAKLQFSSIVDLIDFETETRTFGSYKDFYRLTISGYFTEAQIELAKAGYKATIIKDAE